MAPFPTLNELLSYLAFLGEEPAALGVLATAVILVVLRDWRWSLLALATQYVMAGWLLTRVLEPQIAVLKIMVGLMICVVLYLTARQVRWENLHRGTGARAESDRDGSPRPRRARSQLPTEPVFRLLISVSAAIIILHVTSSGRASLPELPAHINLASISLMAMALLALGLTDEPLTAGMGLLTFMSGFELWYHSLEQAIITIGFLVVIDFLIATVTAYLTIAHHLSAEETRRRRLT